DHSFLRGEIMWVSQIYTSIQMIPTSDMWEGLKERGFSYYQSKSMLRIQHQRCTSQPLTKKVSKKHTAIRKESQRLGQHLDELLIYPAGNFLRCESTISRNDPVQSAIAAFLDKFLSVRSGGFDQLSN